MWQRGGHKVIGLLLNWGWLFLTPLGFLWLWHINKKEQKKVVRLVVGPRDRVIGTNVSKSYFHDEPIHLGFFGPVVMGKTFERCKIYGPSVVALAGHIMENSTIQSNMAQEIMPVRVFWDLGSEDRPLPAGTIVALNCVFRQCEFWDVGFIGSSEQVGIAKRGTTVLIERPML